MLRLAITMLILALLSAVFGFGGLAVEFAGVARILFIVFLALFAISAISSALRGRAPV